jgi:tRNA(Ile)-lysidine synthase
MVIQYDKAVITSSKNYDFSVKFDKIYYTTHEFFSTKKSGPSTSGVSLSPSDFPIVIRNARHGDKIAMRYGTKKVSRFFIDRKIKMEERRVWPVVENAQGEVILVVGLGCDKYHYSQQPNLFVVK